MIKRIDTFIPAGIYHDYLQGLPQATKFLGRHYSETAVFADTADRVSNTCRTDRAELVSLLRQRRVGCGTATELLQKLTDPRAVVVVAG